MNRQEFDRRTAEAKFRVLDIRAALTHMQSSPDVHPEIAEKANELLKLCDAAIGALSGYPTPEE